MIEQVAVVGGGFMESGHCVDVALTLQEMVFMLQELTTTPAVSEIGRLAPNCSKRPA